MQHAFTLLLSALMVTIMSCSAVDNGGGDGNGNGGDSFAAQLTGNWSGHMINKTVDAGSNLRESSVNAEFKFTSETEGSFIFTLPKLENARAEGTFADFAGKSLHLTITKSTVSTIGASGTSTSINYNMIGSEMELYNDRVVLQLIKSAGDKPQPGTPGNPSEPTKEDRAIGLWNCSRDSFGNRWRINIKSTTAFYIEVSANSGNASNTWLDGALTLQTTAEKGTHGSGVVTSSYPGEYVGMRLNFSVPDAGTLNVDRFKSKDAADTTIEDAFQCSKA